MSFGLNDSLSLPHARRSKLDSPSALSVHQVGRRHNSTLCSAINPKYLNQQMTLTSFSVPMPTQRVLRDLQIEAAASLVLEMLAALTQIISRVQHSPIRENITLRQGTGISKHEHGWRYIVRKFTPAYDSIPVLPGRECARLTAFCLQIVLGDHGYWNCGKTTGITIARIPLRWCGGS